LENTVETVINIISSVLNKDKEEINLDSTLQELQIDSLDIMEIITEIEQSFSIDITGYDIAKVKTVKHIINIVTNSNPS